MAYETGRQYLQTDLPGDVFNAGNGAAFGNQKVIVNSNGTRSFENSSGGNGGGASPRLDFAKGLTDKIMTSDQAERGKVDTARGSLINHYKGLENPTDRFTRLAESTGFNQQSKLVEGLTREVMTQQDLVESIPDSVRQRSGDFLINDADKTAITSREQRPVLDNLNKLLRNKQYEEIGLQGKQQLVSTLLDLSFKGDEMGAKPLQLGVDYTSEDRQIARELFTTILSSQSSAFSGDQDANDSNRRASEQRSFEEMMFGRREAADSASQGRTFAQQDKSDATNFSQQLLLKGMSDAKSSSDKASTAAKKAAEQKTDDSWNKILAGSKTEYDVWKKINSNQKTLGSQGVDVSKLWSQHAALAAKTGTGGSIRKEASDDL